MVKFLAFLLVITAWISVWGPGRWLMQMAFNSPVNQTGEGANAFTNSIIVWIALIISVMLSKGIWKVTTITPRMPPPPHKCPNQKCASLFHRMINSRTESYDIKEGDATATRSYTIYTRHCDDCQHQWETLRTI